VEGGHRCVPVDFKNQASAAGRSSLDFIQIKQARLRVLVLVLQTDR
jgi:hypothetical protein